jgi:hypothetical protein
MGQWIDKKPTMYLRWIMRGDERVLQQLWKVTRGENGRILYTEEWVDIQLDREAAQ